MFEAQWFVVNALGEKRGVGHGASEVNVSRLDVAVDSEVKMMCSTLSTDDAARIQIMQVHQRRLRTRRVFDAARVVLARCRRRFSAEGFAIPVLTKLDRLTEFLDESVSLVTALFAMNK